MTTAPEPLRAALAGRYDLEEMVGRGGMATVFRARDVKHGRSVAVKVLRADLAEAIGPERFLREIDVAAHLMHPHILPLYDSGEAADTLYYVMPFVADESLRGLLSRVRLVDTAGAVDVVTQIAAALDYAHLQGILHRDIKPENILLPGGQAVLADFGIAKAVSSATDAGNLTRTGIALGTPGYMSPEQAAGVLDLDAATDIYSLGVVAYEMLLGGLPRVWVTPDTLATGTFRDAPPDHRLLLERLPPGMERALVRALALRPEERYATAGEFAAALASPETVAAPPPAAPARAAVSPVPVPAAAASPDRPSTSATAPLGSGGGVLGAPTRVQIERVVDGIVPAEEFDFLLDEIRTALGRVGYAATAGSSLYWTARKPKEPMRGFDLGNLWETMQSEDAPDILVRIVTRQGQTRIRIEQRMGDMAGGIFGGVWGGGGGGGVAVILGVGLPLHASLLFVIPGAVAVAGGTYVLSRGIYRAVVAHRRRVLEDLADRLVEQCEELAR